MTKPIQDHEKKQTPRQHFNQIRIESSYNWKIWHSFTLIISSLLYCFASVGYFSFLIETLHGEEIGGWIFSSACLFNILANDTEWSLYKIKYEEIYSKEESSNKTIDINFIINFIGFLLFLVGNLCYVPDLNSSLYGTFIPIGCVLLNFSFLSKFTKLYNRFNEIESVDTLRKADFLYSISYIIYGICGFLMNFDEITDYMDLVTAGFLLGGVIHLSGSVMITNAYFSCKDDEKDGYVRIS